VARFEDRFPALPGHPRRLEQPAAAPWSRRATIVKAVVGVAVGGLLVLAVLFLPRLLLDWDLAGGTAPDRARAVNDIRAGLLQAAAGLVVIVGAFLTWRQLQVSRAGQVTDAFSAAITQLGDADLDVRLGGIYALERIARTSKHDRRAIEEVLCLFVKNRDTADVNVALLVLGRRQPAGARLRLDRARLSGVRLQFARLSHADLHYATLDGAHLFGVHLDGADLTGTDLTGAVLIDANLRRADLRDATLVDVLASNADLRAADLSRADLTGAKLDHADLSQADLRGAVLHNADITNAVFTGAVVDDDTRWPEGPTPPGTTRTDLPLRPRTYGEATP
jgi:hypothetical protein